jgi:hypothetical protein
MAAKPPQKSPQKALRKNFTPQTVGENELIRLPGAAAESLAWWVEQYFKFEVTTAASSQAVQRRDLGLFCRLPHPRNGE